MAHDVSISRAAVLVPLAVLGLAAVGIALFALDSDEPPVEHALFGDTVAVEMPDAGEVSAAGGAFMLTAAYDDVHTIQVPDGETRTAVVTTANFNAVLEAWRVDRRVDASSTLPEILTLDAPGTWIVGIEGYDNEGGSYTFEVAPDGISETLTVDPGRRRPHGLTVAPGESKTVTVTSSEFDVVLRVFERGPTVDAHVGGTPEEYRLDRTGEWELIVRSYDRTHGGEYTLEVR